jgi:hypothetical protein
VLPFSCFLSQREIIDIDVTVSIWANIISSFQEI